MKKLLFLFALMSVILLQTAEAKTFQFDGNQTEIIAQTDAVQVQKDPVIIADFDFAINKFLQFTYEVTGTNDIIIQEKNALFTYEYSFMHKLNLQEDIIFTLKPKIVSFYKFLNRGGLSSGGAGNNSKLKK
ncbi:MAG: hypothetical protein P1P88_24560 [Bacteroidales bacterium]|nr:hypothetical protein [Bacteroidales bacterium]